jgi:hypothetical protein
VLKGALDWFVRNVRATTPGEPVSIEVERNREAAIEMGAENPPDVPVYTFRLGLRAGFSGELRAGIPVYKKVNPNPHPVLKEIFYCEVAGSVLEAANVHALREKVARMLEALAPAKALPLAYFRVPALDYSLPVYEEGGEIVCPVIAGPKLKASELAAMRLHVYRYLLNAGYVSDESQVDLRVVRPSDLKLVPPAAIICSIDDPNTWLATVEGRSAEGLVIGLLGEATELRPEERVRAGAQPLSSPPAATDIASLLRLVSSGLVQAGRIDDPFALFAKQVGPEIWARTEDLTDEVGHKLSCWLEGEEPTQLELPLRRTAAGELVTALHDQGICVFIASEESVLAHKVGRYLSDHGFLRWEDTVEVVAEERAKRPAPAEHDRIVGAEDIQFSRLEFGPQLEREAVSSPASEEKVLEAIDKEEEEVGLP